MAPGLPQKGLRSEYASQYMPGGNQRLKNRERRPVKTASLRGLPNGGNQVHEQPHDILFGSTDKEASRRRGLISPARPHGKPCKRWNRQRNSLKLLNICVVTCHDRLLKSVSLLYLYVERGGAKTTSACIFFDEIDGKRSHKESASRRRKLTQHTRGLSSRMK